MEPAIKIKYLSIALLTLAALSGCKHNVVELKNRYQGKLKASIRLNTVGEKTFQLDSSTAPRPQYMQMYTDSGGTENLTFLNTYNKSIYFYDYNTTQYSHKNDYRKLHVALPSAYLVKNSDSIYIYDRKKNELILTDHLLQSKKVIPLITHGDVKNYNWVHSFPQYYPHTVTPILQVKREIIFPGQYMTAIPDSIVDKFKFTAHVDMDKNRVRYTHRYPRTMYGNSYNWEEEGLFPTVYYDLTDRPEEMVFSFPVSHDLYLSDITNERYKVVYGGSNNAGTITSIDKDLESSHLTPEELILKVCQTDLYGAIKYDKYRHVYYRFLRKAMPGATKETDWKDKQVAVIVFDQKLKYLGETVIGTLKNCNWENSFVTAQGLNIEFIDPKRKNEDFLTLKIFTPVNI
jgi:hypothetical protein